MTRDYKRNGTVDLFAAMNIATGQVLTGMLKRQSQPDPGQTLTPPPTCCAFSNTSTPTVARGLAVHVVLDNLFAHSAPEITQWLAHRDRRRWHLHFTSTSTSWLNLIERWFRELTDKRSRRGRFTCVAELDAITTWATHWNTDPKPFI